MRAARTDFGRLVASAAGRLAASAAMLAAAAAIVLAMGASSLFGALGALVSGGARTVVERATARADGRPGVPAGGAIVAAAPAIGPTGATRTAPRGRRGGGRQRSGRRRGPGGGGRPGTPGAGSPGAGVGAPGPGGGVPVGGGPSPPPPPRRGVVEGAAETVREAGRQAPAPARPLVDQVSGGLVDTCRRLPVCP